MGSRAAPPCGADPNRQSASAPAPPYHRCIELVDSHFHIFRRASTKQAGILAAPYLQRDFLWPHYQAATARAGVEASVMVQVNEVPDPLIEAGWVSSVAATAKGPNAIVGYAQLESASNARRVYRLD